MMACFFSSSFTNSVQRCCHCPKPDIPAINREPSVCQNSNSDISCCLAVCTSCSKTAVFPEPEGPINSTLSGRRPDSFSASCLILSSTSHAWPSNLRRIFRAMLFRVDFLSGRFDSSATWRGVGISTTSLYCRTCSSQKRESAESLSSCVVARLRVNEFLMSRRTSCSISPAPTAIALTSIPGTQAIL